MTLIARLKAFAATPTAGTSTPTVASPSIPTVHSSSTSSTRSSSQAMTSLILDRIKAFGKWGVTYGGKRDLSKVLGYPQEITFEDYWGAYKRSGLAKRLVTIFPQASWRDIRVEEDPDPDIETQFEQDLDKVFNHLGVTEKLKRVDILSRIGGHYAILLLGAKGAASTPLPNNLGVDGILYIKPYSQQVAKVTELNTDPASERFGMPEMYTIDVPVDLTIGNFGIPTTTSTGPVKVHHTRVIHHAYDTLDSDIIGTPLLESVFDWLLDLTKIVGGGAEATWVQVDGGRLYNVDPDTEVSEEEQSRIEDDIDDMRHGLIKDMYAQGMDVSTMSQGKVPQVSANANTVLTLIAGSKSIPKRILVGSERGELASSQDRNNFDDAVAADREENTIPLMTKVIDRLIAHDVVTVPKQFDVVWPLDDGLSSSERAAVAKTMAEANDSQSKSGGTLIASSDEIRSTIYQWDPLEKTKIDKPTVD